MTADAFVRLAALAVSTPDKRAVELAPLLAVHTIRRHPELLNYFLSRMDVQRVELLERIALACAHTLVTCSP